MEMNGPRRIRIVGAGPGSPEYFTLAGRRAVQESDLVLGGQRLLDLVPDHPMRVVAGPGVASTLAAISHHHIGRRIAVLVSGDPGLFSLARLVIAQFGRSECEVIPGVSTLQVAFARVALDWLDARVVDAHGAAPELPVADLAGVAKAAVFLGSPRAEDWLTELAGLMTSSHVFVACSSLTMADERVWEVRPQDLRLLATAPRTVLLALRKDLWP